MNLTQSVDKPAADYDAERTRAECCFRPAVDILESDEELLLHADVPGAASDGIDVQFEDGLLTVYAKTTPRHEDVEFLVREYGIGDYYRTFRVHEAVDAERISAQLADGVLTVRLPKAAAAKPRKIAIQAG